LAMAWPPVSDYFLIGHIPIGNFFYTIQLTVFD
jgi:hypothetical protein